MPVICEVDGCNEPAALKRPKSGHAMCKECFFTAFEFEIHATIASENLFKRGDKVAMGASGGKDSTVLAHIMKLLNERHDYGLELFLLSIDEGITGYRDDSLETVKQNRDDYQLPLKILSYKDLYGWTMDEIVAQIGNKNNCTFCGTFRRQALDRGAALLGADMIVTGHNADDIAETVIMNIMRGDYARLSRCTNILTQGEGSIPRCKPLKYAYEKEIVMYAHYKKLVYFSTECKYAPNAYRGHTREYIKQIERIRPTCILDIIHAGENMDISDCIKLPERRTCSRCGFVASQEVCKACVLLEGLNTGNPKLGIGKSNKAKRAMGLKVVDGSENKTKTRVEKGISKKKQRREEKKQKQMTMMCGGRDGEKEGCGSGCGSYIPPEPVELSSTFEPICSPDHEKITVRILKEWLDPINFDNLIAIKNPECYNEDEEEICGNDCPSKKLACEEDAINVNSVSSCSSRCKSSDDSLLLSNDSKLCCKVPLTSVSDNNETSDADTEENKEEASCNCPLELLENPNHPEVIIDAEEFGFDIHVFKSLMIANHPEIVDELRKLEEESGEDLSGKVTVPSKSIEKSVPVKSKSKNKDDISELTSRVKGSVSIKTESQVCNEKPSISSTTNETESTEVQSADASGIVEPAIVKANVVRKGASLVTPEMMHKAPNNLDF